MSESDEAIKGRCVCGAVRFEITRPREVVACNCALCRRTNALWAYVPPAKGAVTAAEGATVGYSHGDKTIVFHHCATCGAATHWQSLLGDTFAVNLRLVDDPAILDAVPVRAADGADPDAFVS